MGGLRTPNVPEPRIMPSGGNRSGQSIRQRVTAHPGKNKWHEHLPRISSVTTRGLVSFSTELFAHTMSYFTFQTIDRGLQTHKNTHTNTDNKQKTAAPF